MSSATRVLRLPTPSPGAVAIYIFLSLGAVIMVVPFLWMLVTSIESFGEATRVPPILIPATAHWQNYGEVLTELPFLNFYRNTIIMTVVRTGADLLFASLSAYAFARIEFPGRTFLFFVALSVMMVPGGMLLIPQYLIISHLGLVNTLPGLILPGMFSAFGMFLLRQFFLSVPAELEQAARLDGANHLQIYWHVMLPLVKSALVALAIIKALSAWNDLLWPLIVINSPDKLTLSAGIALLQGEHITEFPLLMAGTALAMWPMILLFIVLQKQFIEGVALSGLKG